MGRELNYSALTPAEYEYRLSLNDRFITSVLEAKKIVIIDGQQEKPLAHSDVTFGEFIDTDDGNLIPVSVKIKPR